MQEEAQPSEPAAEGEDTQVPPEEASGSQAQEPEEPAREGDKEDGQTTETEKASDTDSNISTDVSAPLPAPTSVAPAPPAAPPAAPPESSVPALEPRDSVCLPFGASQAGWIS